MSVYTKASHFVVFGQPDRMEIYQFIVSIKITYCEISNVIVINLGSNMEEDLYQYLYSFYFCSHIFIIFIPR